MLPKEKWHASKKKCKWESPLIHISLHSITERSQPLLKRWQQYGVVIGTVSCGKWKLRYCLMYENQCGFLSCVQHARLGFSVPCLMSSMYVYWCLLIFKLNLCCILMSLFRILGLNCSIRMDYYYKVFMKLEMFGWLDFQWTKKTNNRQKSGWVKDNRLWGDLCVYSNIPHYNNITM